MVLYETHPAASRTPSDESVLQSYAALFSRLRFNAFVLQSGFTTGAFMVMASASASLMTELLHRPATEFGLYFLLFPIGFFTGNLISSRIGNRVSIETMVLAGSVLALLTVVGQALALWHGLRDAAGVLPAGHVHHHVAGHRHALRARSAPWPKFRALPAPPPASACSCRISSPRCSPSFTGLLADGTPWPMT